MFQNWCNFLRKSIFKTLHIQSHRFEKILIIQEQFFCFYLFCKTLYTWSEAYKEKNQVSEMTGLYYMYKYYSVYSVLYRSQPCLSGINGLSKLWTDPVVL